jgi:hypothetical protein
LGVHGNLPQVTDLPIPYVPRGSEKLIIRLLKTLRKLVSQSAVSEDSKRINREVIEGMRFLFVSKNILANYSNERNENILDINQVQSGSQLYESGEELLEDLLKSKQFKHHRELRYLAEKHAGKRL